MEKKFPSLHDYKKITNDEARWARIFLLELLQERLGMFIVTADGKLNNELLTKLESAIRSKGGQTSEKAIKKLFCADSELATGFPAGKTILAFKTYIESGKKLECPVSTTKELTELAIEKVAERKLREELAAKNQASTGLGSLPLINSENQSASETVPSLKSQDGSGNQELPILQIQGSSGITHFYQIVQRWRIGVRSVARVLAALLLVSFVSRWLTTVSHQNDTRSESANASIPTNLPRPLKVSILPFYRQNKEDKNDIENNIRIRIKNTIETEKLNAIVDCFKTDSIAGTREDAKRLGQQCHADIVVYGVWESGTNYFAIHPKFERIDTTITQNFTVPGIPCEGFRMSVNQPADILYGTSILNGVLYAIYWTLGSQAYDLKDFDTALKLFHSADSVINTGVAGYCLGHTYSAKGMMDKAVSEFERYLRFYPKESEAHFQLANFYTYSKFDEYRAEYHFKELLAQDSDNVAVHLAFGQYLNGIHQHEKAIEHIEGLLIHHPDLIDAHFLLGDLYRTCDQGPNRAMEEYQKAMALAPDSLAIHENFALRLFWLDENTKLKKELRYLFSHGGIKYGYKILGWHCLKKHQYGRAYDFLESAAAMDSTDFEAAYWYLITLWKLGKEDELPGKVRPFLTDPENLYPGYLTLGEHYAWKGDLDSTMYFYKQSFSIGGSGPREWLEYTDYLADNFCAIDSAIAFLVRCPSSSDYMIHFKLGLYLLRPERIATTVDSAAALSHFKSFKYSLTGRKDLCDLCHPHWVLKTSDSIINLLDSANLYSRIQEIP